MERKNITKEKFDGMSEHEQQMALLSLELELRKEFVSNIEAMKGRVIEKDQTLEEKEKKLDLLLPQIHQIRKVISHNLDSLMTFNFLAYATHPPVIGTSCCHKSTFRENCSKSVSCSPIKQFVCECCGL